jgi:hypothetical protein
VILFSSQKGRDALKSLLHAMKFHDTVHRRIKQQLKTDNEVDPSTMYLKVLAESHEWTVKNFAAFIAKLDAMVRAVQCFSVGHKAKLTTTTRLNNSGLAIGFRALQRPRLQV